MEKIGFLCSLLVGSSRKLSLKAISNELKYTLAFLASDKLVELSGEPF